MVMWSLPTTVLGIIFIGFVLGYFFRAYFPDKPKSIWTNPFKMSRDEYRYQEALRKQKEERKTKSKKPNLYIVK